MKNTVNSDCKIKIYKFLKPYKEDMEHTYINLDFYLTDWWYMHSPNRKG